MADTVSAEDVQSRVVLESLALHGTPNRDNFGYKLLWRPTDIKGYEYAVAEEIDGHYVLFHGSSSGGSSVFGVSRERNDADKRLRDRLLGRVNYANFWSRGIKYTLEDRTQQCTTD